MNISKTYINKLTRVEFLDGSSLDAFVVGFDDFGVYLQTQHDYNTGHENVFVPYTSIKYIHYLTRDTS